MLPCLTDHLLAQSWDQDWSGSFYFLFSFSFYCISLFLRERNKNKMLSIFFAMNVEVIRELFRLILYSWYLMEEYYIPWPNLNWRGIYFFKLEFHFGNYYFRTFVNNHLQSISFTFILKQCLKSFNLNWFYEVKKLNFFTIFNPFCWLLNIIHIWLWIIFKKNYLYSVISC